MAKRLLQGVDPDDIRETEGAMEKAAEEIDILRAALSFYGDYLSYGSCRFEGPMPEVMKDNGKLARRCLENTQ